MDQIEIYDYSVVSLNSSFGNLSVSTPVYFDVFVNGNILIG